MIRPILLAAATLVGVAACTAPPAAESQPPAGSTASAPCDATKAQFAVGERYSDALAERARTAAGAATVRRLVPGQVVTMEYNGTRLNLDTDAAGRVTSARCG
jgi:hypothetical protein